MIKHPTFRLEASGKDITNTIRKKPNKSKLY